MPRAPSQRTTSPAPGEDVAQRQKGGIWRAQRDDWGSLGGELPQSKPAALPAPSGREPLALPETLCFGWKACGSTPSVTACAVPAPPRGRLWHCRKVCRHHQSRPLGEGGCERSEQTEGVRLRGCIIPSSHFFYQSVTFRFMQFVVYYGQHGSPWLH